MNKIFNWYGRNWRISWIITIAIGIFIYYISSLQFGTGSGGTGSINATLYHIIVFVFFAMFLEISLSRGRSKIGIIAGLIVAFLYAISDEWHQSFVPGRDSSFKDILLDSLGIIIGSVIYSANLDRKHFK